MGTPDEMMREPEDEESVLPGHPLDH